MLTQLQELQELHQLQHVLKSLHPFKKLQSAELHRNQWPPNFHIYSNIACPYVDFGSHSWLLDDFG